MNSQQKIVNVLTICRKSGRFVGGFDAVKEMVQEGNVSCVIVTEDISPNTLKEIKFVCANCNVDIVELEIDSYDMFSVAGKQIVVAAICDYGLAQKVRDFGKGGAKAPITCVNPAMSDSSEKPAASTRRKRRPSGNRNDQ